MVASPAASALSDRWRRLTEALQSDWLFRWPTFLLYTAVGVPFVSISEHNRLTEPNLTSAIGIAVLSVGLTIALIIVAAPIIRTSSRWRVPIVLLSLVVIGVLRAAIVTAIIDGFDINRESFFLSRALLSAGAVPVLFVTSAFITATVARGWRERHESRQAIQKLRTERDAILDEIAHADTVILTESEQTLRPQVGAILESLGTSSRTSISDALDKLISTVVRPLSHSLAARARSHKTSVDSIRPALADPPFPTADSFVGPLSAAAAVYLTTIVTLFDVVPIIEAVTTGLIGAGVTWAALRTFQALMAGLAMSIRTIVIIVILANLGIGLVVAWVNISAFREYRVGFEITIALLAATLVPGLLYVAQRLVAHLGSVRLAELSVARRDMSLEVSEVRRRAWLRQRHIAHALHSAIQSRVHAEAQLVRGGTGPVSEREADRVASTLQSMFDVLRNTEAATHDAAGELRRAIEFWDGMCAINFALDVAVESLMDNDPDVGEAVLVTSLEVINNAIRHGKATVLSLEIDLASVDLIRIVGTNNGVVLNNHTPGLGMSMFDELTAYWSLSSDEDTTFTGYIAARQPATEQTMATI
jgi:MFS family permease